MRQKALMVALVVAGVFALGEAARLGRLVASYATPREPVETPKTPLPFRVCLCSCAAAGLSLRGCGCGHQVCAWTPASFTEEDADRAGIAKR